MTTLVIIYDSKTGNTEQIAKSIAEGAKSVSGVDVILKKDKEEDREICLIRAWNDVYLKFLSHLSFNLEKVQKFEFSLDNKKTYRINAKIFKKIFQAIFSFKTFIVTTHFVSLLFLNLPLEFILKSQLYRHIIPIISIFIVYKSIFQFNE